jgi:hypothetical protein
MSDGIEMCRGCPDWKYRSWKHNYWKIVNTAEQKRIKKLEELHSQDMEDCITDLNGQSNKKLLGKS